MCGVGLHCNENFPRQGDKPIVEACGPVQTNESAAFYVGATRTTNNTGEIRL